MDINLFRHDPNFTLIAVTGGPCAGKTSYLAQARQRFENYGLKVVVLPEVATELSVAGLPPTEKWENPRIFQEQLLLYSLEKENRYYLAMKELVKDHPCVLLCDRGVLDPIAYVGRSDYLSILESNHFNLHDLRERYRMVVHMVTAADGAEEYYTLDNNPARTEGDLSQARDLDKLTQRAWFGHQNLVVIDNSTGFEEKKRRALASLSRVLDMPEPREIERKFEILNFHPNLLPDDAVAVKITQDYLTSNTATVERRVRRRELDGSSSYYYTEKESTDHNEERIEREKEISLGEYESLLNERDSGRQTIKKVRHCFVHGSHYLEVDVYTSPVEGLAVCEVELRDRNEKFQLPDDWEVEEKTDDPRYSNYNIAGGSLG